ncbi:MAG: DNRLRE domain-containing protein, partial [Nanoarchaeota archaeon]
SYAAPIISDLVNNDNIPEIIIFEDRRRVLIYNLNGTLNKKIELNIQSNEYINNWFLTDLNSDGAKEFVFLSNSFSGEYPNLKNTSKVYVIKANGASLSDKWPFVINSETDHYLTANVSVGDFNNDKKPEIVVYSKNQIHILDAEANEISGSPFNDPSNSYSPVIGNVSNSDGSSFITITDPSYYLDSLKLIGFKNGTFSYVAGFPKYFHNEYSFGFTTGNPSLTDMDNDGKVDLTLPVNASTGFGFMLNIDNFIYSFKTDFQMDKSDWPQFLRDDTHSNSYVDFSPIAVQEITLSPNADSFVRSSAPTQNFGTGERLQNDDSPEEITFIRFNLTSLTGKTIKSAKLVLTVNDPTNANLNLRRAEDKDWAESGITYNNRPNFVTTITSFNAKKLNSKVTLDVRTPVDNLKGGKVTFGIKATSDDSGAFYSRQAANVNYRPQLVIEYQ